MRRHLRPRHLNAGDFLTARAVLWLLLALYTATMVGPPDNPDGEVEFQTTRSLATGDGLAISTSTNEGAAIIAARMDVREGAGGHFYSWFGIGQAAVGVPFYWFGNWMSLAFPGIERRYGDSEPFFGTVRSEFFAHLAVGWRNPLFGALTAYLVALCSLRLACSRPAGFWTGLSYGLCTFAWPQARASLSDVQASFFAVLAFYFLLVVRERFLRFERPPAYALLALGGSLAMLVLTRIALAPVAVVLFLGAVWIVAAGRRRLWSSPMMKAKAGTTGALRDLFWLAMLPVVGAALMLYVNYLRFGDPFETGYSAAVLTGGYFNYPPLSGLLGVTIAPGKGLLWFAPLVVLAPLGFARHRYDRLVLLLTVGIVAAVLAPVITTQGFHAGWTFGPRYLLPVLPFLWMGVAFTFEALRNRPRSRRVAVVLALFGFVSSFGGVLVDQSTYHDLALQGARVAWPTVPGETERERDETRFVMLHWDWRFAAPWAHWRILRHRVAVPGERFPVREIFFVDEPTMLTPTYERDKGFKHLIWAFLNDRLDGRAWPALGGCLVLFMLGVVQAVRGLDPTRP